MTAMAEENRLTAEQLSTIEKLVKLSIVFTVVTPFVFRILLLALPPLPAEIAAAKLYIVLFMVFFFCLVLFINALYQLLRIIIGTNLCLTTLPHVYLFSVIWFGTCVLFLIYVAVMVWNIISQVVQFL
jgi:hypothetical protein